MNPRVLGLIAWALCASSAMAQAIHDTGTVRLEVFSDGQIGRQLGPNTSITGAGFVYDGRQALFVSTLLVGTSGDRLAGEIYDFGDWVSVAAPRPLSPPFPAPFEAFDQGFEAVFDDSGMSNPLGLVVTQRSYSSVSAPYNDLVVLQYEIRVSQSPIDGAYAGIFLDLDLGSPDTVQYDEATSSIYQFYQVGPNVVTPYFGMAVLDCPVAGYADVSNLPGGNGADALVFPGISARNDDFSVPADNDSRLSLGAGPARIASGQPLVVTFALIAGDDEADFLANAAAVNAFVVAEESGPEADADRISPPTPNPTSTTTRLSLFLDAPESVRVTVMDALGRTVATLSDETLAAGETALVLDAGSLAPGVYVVRAEGETFRQSRLVTVAR